jgi:transposase
VLHHWCKNAYSEDLRRKIADAVERGMFKSEEVARLFGVSLSSDQRYVRMVREGRPLSPKKARLNKQTSVPQDTRCPQVQTLLVINATLALVTSCWTKESSLHLL